MRLKKWTALGLAQIFMFVQTHTASAGIPTTSLRTPVLRHVMLEGMKAARTGQLDEHEFIAAKDRALNKMDEAIERLSESRMGDAEFRAKAVKQLKASASKAEKRLEKMATKEMTDDAVAQALAHARADERYSRCLARHQDARDALVACLAMDLRAATLATETSIATKTKADVLSELAAARDRLTALRYDGGDYDEFYEFTWYCWGSEDTVIVFIFFIPMLVVDTVLTPFVFLYKVTDYFFGRLTAGGAPY